MWRISTFKLLTPNNFWKWLPQAANPLFYTNLIRQPLEAAVDKHWKRSSKNIKKLWVRQYYFNIKVKNSKDFILTGFLWGQFPKNEMSSVKDLADIMSVKQKLFLKHEVSNIPHTFKSRCGIFCAVGANFLFFQRSFSLKYNRKYFLQILFWKIISFANIPKIKEIPIKILSRPPHCGTFEFNELICPSFWFETYKWLLKPLCGYVCGRLYRWSNVKHGFYPCSIVFYGCSMLFDVSI